MPTVATPAALADTPLVNENAGTDVDQPVNIVASENEIIEAGSGVDSARAATVRPASAVVLTPVNYGVTWSNYLFVMNLHMQFLRAYIVPGIFLHY